MICAVDQTASNTPGQYFTNVSLQLRSVGVCAAGKTLHGSRMNRGSTLGELIAGVITLHHVWHNVTTHKKDFDLKIITITSLLKSTGIV